jgi:hypothetical protein
VSTSGAPAKPSGDSTLIVEALDGAAWRSQRAVDAESLSARIRNRFDPSGVLNPGILGVAA